MILRDVMQELRDRLSALPKLNTYDHLPGKPAVPCAVVALPEEIKYDLTYGRGLDSMRMEITVLLQQSPSKSATYSITAYADPTGTHSVKTALEKDIEKYTSCDDVHVVSCEFDIVRYAAVDYLACIFMINVEGQGT